MNFLFECAPINPLTGVPATYRFSSIIASSSGTLLDGKEWEAAIIETPITSTVFFQSGLVQQSSTDYGSITIQLTARTASLAQMLWDGATGRVWVGVAGQPFTSYRKIFEGTLGAHSKNGDALKIPLYGLDFKLNETNILTATYAGTGGAEGPADIKGNYKPRAYGSCRYVTPVRINDPYVVYQVHDGACVDIRALYENALSLGNPVATVSTYAQLTALSLAPGTWAKAPSIGMFRLGSEPSGKFTVDVVGDVSGGVSLASISKAILIGAGMASSDIDPSLASVAGSITWNTYITDQVTVGDTLRTAFANAFLYANSNEAGKFQAGSWLANGETLNVGGSEAAFNVIPQSLSLQEAAPSTYSVTINAEICWTVHSNDDISPAIAELQEGQQALEEAAEAAQATADQAVANIVVEKARTDAILNDGVLDRSEKAERKLAYAGIAADRAKIISQANGYGVSATAYTNAFAALASYLNALSPAWNDLTQDTPIERSTWDAAWEGERSARVATLQAIEDASAKLARWDGVSGDGKPEDNATVGAPNGTNIGGRPVVDFLGSVDTAHAAQLRALATTELQRIRDRALLYPGPDGASIYTLNVREETARQTADSAFVETFSLLGAVTPAGDAFVLDDTTVQVTKDMAGATVYQSVKARFGDAEGAIEDVRQVIETNEGSLAQTVEAINARFGEHEGSITELKEVLADENGTVAKALLEIDVDNRVIGFSAYNDGRKGSFTVTADKFVIEDPDTGEAYFYADDTGKVIMHDVEVDTLKIGAMDPEFIDKQEPFDGREGTQILPGGVVMKWGKYRAFINSETVFSIVFVEPFPNSCDAFVPTPYLNSFSNLRDLWIQNIGSASRFGATVATQAATGDDQRLDGFDWIAFGR